MGRKSIHTPRSRIKSALRQVWLRGRERAKALKLAGYCCAECGRKQSKAKGRELKIEVHHKRGILNWDVIMAVVYEHLMCPAEELEVLCVECHDKITKEEGKLLKPKK